MGLVNVSIRVIDEVSSPIDGVYVAIYDTLGEFVTSGDTGFSVPGSGELELLLDGGDPASAYLAILHRAGYSFGENNSFVLSVDDPPGVGDNEFEFSAIAGLQGKLVTLSVDDDGLPLEGVQISIFDEADSFITSAVTNSVGEVSTILQGATDPGTRYILRLSAAGYSFDNGPTQTIQVVTSEVNTFDFTASAPELPQATDPLMCRVTGRLSNAALQGKRYTITFSTQYVDPDVFTGLAGAYQVVSDSVVAGEVAVLSSSSGEFDFTLPRGGVFDLRVHGMEHPGPRVLRAIHIPNLAGALLADIVYPYLVEAAHGLGAVELAVDDDPVVAALTLLRSDGYSLETASTMLEVASSDPEVAGASLIGLELFITPYAAGTTEVTLVRKEGTWAERYPPVDALVASPISVTVTA